MAYHGYISHVRDMACHGYISHVRGMACHGYISHVRGIGCHGYISYVRGMGCHGYISHVRGMGCHVGKVIDFLLSTSLTSLVWAKIPSSNVNIDRHHPISGFLLVSSYLFTL
jgi:hypothetical protein